MSDEFVRKDVYEADQNTIVAEIASIQDRLDDYKESTTRQNNNLGIMIAIIAFIFAGMQIGIAITLFFLTR